MHIPHAFVLRTLFVAILLAAPLAPVPAPAAPSSTEFSMTWVRDTVIDPSSGRLFVAGDDEVEVFDSGGDSLTSIAGVDGAGGLALTATDLFATETETGSVVRISLATLTVAQTYPIGDAVLGPLAVLGGEVWLLTSESHENILTVLDPADGSVDHRPTTSNQTWGGLVAVPGTTDRLLAYTQYTGGVVQKLDTSTDPITVLGAVVTVDSPRDVVVSADGGTFWAAGVGPRGLPEYDVATMEATGLVYAGGDGRNGAAAYSPAAGGAVAWTNTTSVFVGVQGRPALTHTLTTTDWTGARGLELSPDGTRAYVVTGIGGQPTKHLLVSDLSASVTGSAPTSFVAGVPGELVVTGTSMAMTGATVGGTPAVLTQVSTTEVRVAVPTTLGPGLKPFELTGPFGNASGSVTIVANAGATLNGVAKAGSTPVAGVTMTLSGGGLGSPLTTTSGLDGGYAFTGVPYGTTYRLLAHDPTGVHGDQTHELLTLTPNGVTTHDVDFQRSPGAALANVPLPSGTVRDVEVDQVGGRVFVSVGNEVDAFDLDGRLLARFTEQWGADGLALSDGHLYINQKNASRITDVELATLTVSHSWPQTTASDGSLAFAGGKVWFTDGNDQFVGLAALDPATGSVVKTPDKPYYVPRLRAVEGAPDQLLVVSLFVPSKILDVSTFPPTVRSSMVTPAAIAGDAVASDPADRVWTTQGDAFTAAGFGSTGLHYEVDGGAAAAFTPARSGVLALGARIFRLGTTAPSHLLGDAPNDNAIGLDGTGDRAFIGKDGSLAIWDLRPHITAVAPAGFGGPTAAQPSVISGSGLGAAAAVTVDGASVPFTIIDAGHLSVSLPALGSGWHQVRVATPWGTSEAASLGVAPGVPGTSGFHAVAPARFLDSRKGVGATGAWGPAATRDVVVAGTNGIPADATAVVVNLTAVDATAESHLRIWPAGQPKPGASTLNFRSGDTRANLAVVKVGAGGAISIFNSSGSTHVLGDVTGYFDSTGDQFVSLSPARVLDSRRSIGGYATPWGAGTTRPVTVVGGAVPADATAVVLNVTAVDPVVAASHLRVWATGAPMPNVSNLNFPAGETRANQVVVRVGSGGKVNIFNSAGATHVVADVVGYYTPGTGARVTAIQPERLLDSRKGTGDYSSPWGAAETRAVRVAGVGSVPVGAKAVIVNMTSSGATATSHLRVWPTGVTMPTASSLNFDPFQVVANLVVVKLGADGKVNVYNSAGSVDVIADIVAYYR